MLGRAVLGVLACAGCARSDAPAAPPPPAPADAAVDGPAAAAALDAGGVVSTSIASDTAAPAGAPATARVIGGVRWRDRAGHGELYLLEVETYQRTTIALQARLYRGAALVRVVNDRADACADQNLTAFAPPTATVTDLDHDGVAELGFGYLVGCTGARVIAKQLVLIDGAKYIVRGSTPDGGEPEPEAAAWPPGTLGLAEAGFRDNAGALDVTDAVAALPSAELYTVDSEVERVENQTTTGAATVTWSYPRLAMIGAAQGAQLTARMRRFAIPTRRPQAGDVGDHVGRCDLGLVTAEVVSVACTRTSTLGRPGAAPRPGPIALGLTVWRTGDRADLTPAELGLEAARGCAWALTATGVAWRPADADATCGPDRAWAELTPTSARARALIARMGAS
ncbi:MAG: hypothetical protein IPL61_08890 [Myxococcales bacterium]|nr:hypothetical protein [Myxococcales bacterium]